MPCIPNRSPIYCQPPAKEPRSKQRRWKRVKLPAPGKITCGAGWIKEGKSCGCSKPFPGIFVRAVGIGIKGGLKSWRWAKCKWRERWKQYLDTISLAKKTVAHNQELQREQTTSESTKTGEFFSDPASY